MTDKALTHRVRRFQRCGHALAAEPQKTFRPKLDETESAIARFWRKRGLPVPNESPNRAKRSPNRNPNPNPTL